MNIGKYTHKQVEKYCKTNNNACITIADYENAAAEMLKNGVGAKKEVKTKIAQSIEYLTENGFTISGFSNLWVVDVDPTILGKPNSYSRSNSNIYSLAQACRNRNFLYDNFPDLTYVGDNSYSKTFFVDKKGAFRIDDVPNITNDASKNVAIKKISNTIELCGKISEAHLVVSCGNNFGSFTIENASCITYKAIYFGQKGWSFTNKSAHIVYYIDNDGKVFTNMYEDNTIKHYEGIVSLERLNKLIAFS